MSVQLVGANNFQPAKYTVKVSGLTEEALTETVEIEAQKVESIEILDDVAVVSHKLNDSGVFPDGTTATVSYVVKDQYGVDITKTTDLATNDTKIVADKANGVVKISGNQVEGKKLGDLVPVVLIDSKTGKSVSKTVKFSAKSTVSELSVAGLYNAKGEAVTLDDQSKATDAFIVLDLKDQYGKEITDVAEAQGLVITNTNNTILELAQTAGPDSKTVVESQKIDGKDKLVVKFKEIKKAGNVDILFISTTNGKSATYTVEVEETTTTDTISASQPEIAVEGEDILVPITVMDKAGTVITDKKLLADDDKGISVSTKNNLVENDFEVKDGQVFFKAKGLTAGTKALVFQSSTYKVATVTVDVKAIAEAAVIRGLKNPLVLSTEKGAVEVTANHLIIEDQYGRVMKDAADNINVTLVGTSDVVSVDPATNNVTPLKNGTAKLKVKLAGEYTAPGSTTAVDSAVEVEVRVTDGTEYDSYAIKEIGLLKASATSQNFTVNGILNGGTVSLTADEYTAVLNGGNISNQNASSGSFVVKEDNLDKKEGTEDRIDTEFTLTVTIDATGEVIEEKFMVSKKAAATQDFFFTTDGTVDSTDSHKDLKEVKSATLSENDEIATELMSGGKSVKFATTDQYGKEEVKNTVSTIRIVPEKASEVIISDNGTDSATVRLRGNTEEAKLTVNIKIGNATKSLPVTLKVNSALRASEAKLVDYAKEVTDAEAPVADDYTNAGIEIAPLNITEANAAIKGNATSVSTIKSVIANAIVAKEQQNEVNTARDAVQSHSYTALAKDTVNADAAKDLVEAQVNELEAIKNKGFTVTVVTNTDADESGFKASNSGVPGAYHFTVKVEKNGKEATTSSIEVAITAKD